jgi:hypothetical protein
MKLSRRSFLKLSSGTLVACALADTSLIEPFGIVVSHHDVPMRGLPHDLDGLKVAQLSDLHRSMIVPDMLIRTAVRMTNELAPDIVVLTGDFVSHASSNAAPCAEMLSSLKAHRGIYAVVGNHDHWTNVRVVTESLKSHGFEVLSNANTRLSPGLTILGLDDYWAGEPDQGKTWKGANTRDACIFLSHNPGAVREMKGRECLMITGHTHGGQVNIPFIPRNLLPDMRGWKYISGWYREGKVDMYVNRGIGTVFPPIRFMCPPEITLFTLRASA